MPRYKKGDIVICVTDKMYGMTHSLKVGEQYRIDDFIEMSSIIFNSFSSFTLIALWLSFFIKNSPCKT